MGNYVSCTLSGPAGRQSRAAKVIFPGREVQQFHAPTKAAELMLETPNYFLVNSASLRPGRRLSALNADEDLEMANVYVMFPMRRLSSFVTAADMGALFLTASSAAKRGGSRVRALPESGKEREAEATTAAAPKLNLEEIEGFSTTEFMHRLSMSKSKKPLLETITED
ncbi:uncharacterized protein LOC115735105 [Rhodamnia argentea]|uniref:Uncharacterized protein LOC115735105 n=1 Tax=Rhodamnia argentea TaxID=178133 RepID=A0A8B8NIW0_9MYRT|nr:uncharacterized protein LOC115735105 [Rhodamnia argentea]